MPTITIVISDAQYAGLIKAQLQHDLALENTPDEASQVGTPEAYAQFAWARACDSYSAQWSGDTVESLRAQLAASNDAQARAKARADELAAQLEAEKSKTLALETTVAKAEAAGAESQSLSQRLDAL